MSTTRTAAASLGAWLAAVSLTTASAATYTDALGDGALVGVGGGILDIASVEVNNTATDLIFKINLAGDPTATDWGKYMIGIDSAPGGDPAGNGWGRPIGMAGGMDYWFGSWVDSGNGVQLHQFGGSWTQIGGFGTFAGGPPLPGLSITKDTSSLTITAPFSALGLSLGSSFLFDVYTSGGGPDGAVDALGNPTQTIANWGDYYNSQGNVLPYTLVPEPGALALFGVGGLLLLAFRRK
jgi:hypothetical protein